MICLLGSSLSLSPNEFHLQNFPEFDELENTCAKLRAQVEGMRASTTEEGVPRNPLDEIAYKTALAWQTDLLMVPEMRKIQKPPMPEEFSPRLIELARAVNLIAEKVCFFFSLFLFVDFFLLFFST